MKFIIKLYEYNMEQSHIKLNEQMPFIKSVLYITNK